MGGIASGGFDNDGPVDPAVVNIGWVEAGDRGSQPMVSTANIGGIATHTTNQKTKGRMQ